MNNQQAVVDQVVQNLAFDVEAVPKNEAKQTKNGTPLNVKIKVRKKDEINIQDDVSSIADNTSRTIQRVRLVNSDQTIMTFDVFMEAEFEKKPPRKLRKHIFDMLKPGICLGAVDDDEQPYMPSTSYSANITEPTVATKSNGTLKQTFVLAKNVYQTYSTSTQPGVQRWLFGNCKRGGCLDPPFSEDKYSYKPSTRLGPEREDIEIEETKSDILSSSKKPITQHDEETQSNGKHSSIFDNGLFKKKRKSSDKSTNTKLPDKTDSIIDVHPGDSATNSISAHSNPIITYPPKPKSSPRTSTDKTVRSRGPSEDKPRNSFNDHSEPYFVPPKGVQRLKEKLALDPNDQPKHRSSDATDSKIPFSVPIPIPVSFSNDSSKRKLEVIPTNNDIIKKDSIPDQHIPDQKLSDQELQDAINIELPPQHVSPKKPVPVPILFPINYSDPNNTDTDEHSMLNDNIDNDIKLIHPKKSSEIKIMPSINKDTPFEGSKDMEQNLEPGLGENESLSNATPNLKDSNTEIDAMSENVLRTTHNFSDQEDAIPGKFLRTGGNISDQESDTDISVNLDMKRDSKGKLNTDEIRETTKQNDNANKAKINTEDMKPGAKEAEVTDEIIKPAEQNYIKEDTERDSEEEKVTDGIRKLVKQTDIKDKTPTPAYYSKDDIKPDSEGETVIEGTKEPSNQKEIKNEAVIPTKYIEGDIEPYSEGNKISLNRIVKPEKQSELIEDKGMKRDSKEDTITVEIEEPVKQKERQLRLASATIYVENSPDVFGMPDTHQNIGTPEKEEKNDSQRNLSKLPILQNNESLQNASKTSVNKTKTSDTPDFEYGDTDIGEKILSNPHYETDVWDGKEHVGETTKPNNDDKIDSYIEIEKIHTNGKLTNIIAAPVTIDNTEETSILGSIKEFYGEKKLVKSMAPSFKKFDGDKDAHSTMPKLKVQKRKWKEERIKYKRVMQQLTVF
ncbi:hypothetical protein PYW07_002116 [Mythimna separata]|uniref:Uncharacterized protein n=1 Tax=Mythimna separata TaxID=271217 RepID=A0AAD7YM80_MYTSE|nr:hypothetical protein PYW07_002116 [Mythimna separata]